ncbi:MAG: hypothetical protein WAV09_03210 [Minisyncoccia bacterium]
MPHKWTQDRLTRGGWNLKRERANTLVACMRFERVGSVLPSQGGWSWECRPILTGPIKSIEIRYVHGFTKTLKNAKRAVEAVLRVLGDE